VFATNFEPKDIIVGTEKRREKVVVLRELQRAIIYTRELSKQAIEGHVSTAFIVYSVNEGARLTIIVIMLSLSKRDTQRIMAVTGNRQRIKDFVTTLLLPFLYLPRIVRLTKRSRRSAMPGFSGPKISRSQVHVHMPIRSCSVFPNA
jgi:hypothetical protein